MHTVFPPGSQIGSPHVILAASVNSTFFASWRQGTDSSQKTSTERHPNLDWQRRGRSVRRDHRYPSGLLHDGLFNLRISKIYSIALTTMVCTSIDGVTQNHLPATRSKPQRDMEIATKAYTRPARMRTVVESTTYCAT